MHANMKIILVGALASAAIAAPYEPPNSNSDKSPSGPDQAETTNLDQPSEDVRRLTLDARQSGYPNSTCDGIPLGGACAAPAWQWAIYLPAWGNQNSPGNPPCDPSTEDCCAGGFLDNLRGQCGVITNWGCATAGTGGVDSAVSFETPVGCGSDQVQNAFWAASQKDGLSCNYNSDCSIDSFQSFLDLIPDALKGLLEELGGE